MYNLKRLHYSIKGSFLTWNEESDGLLKLTTVHKGQFNEILKINYGKKADISFTPREITVKYDGGIQNICLFETDGTFIKGKGKEFVIDFCQKDVPFDYQIIQNNIIEVCDFRNSCNEMFVPVKGKLILENPRRLGEERSDFVKIHVIPDENGEYEMAVEQNFFEKGAVRSLETSYDSFADINEKNYNEWEKKFNCKNDYEKECAYILWCNTLPAGGNFATEAIVMSKAGMSNVWSWDNAFNALALADVDFRAAMDQFTLMYKRINRVGRVPDSISEAHEVWTFAKPPVQGWMYKQMILKNPEFATPHALEEVYFPMKRNTDWWLNLRGEVPSYYHGNDSGEDNSTCFDGSEHIETSELLAFLSVQCAFLSDAAEKLNMPTDKKVYAQLSKELADKAIKDYWDGERIFVRLAETKEPYYSNALMPLRVIVLENLLPKDIKDYIIKQIDTRFIGKGGIASEALDSPLFIEDGYWRGAAWATDQVMFTTSLRNMGYNELADRIANNYKSSVEKYGFNENTSALTGGPLRCKSYTWAANAYVII